MPASTAVGQFKPLWRSRLDQTYQGNDTRKTEDILMMKKIKVKMTTHRKHGVLETGSSRQHPRIVVAIVEVEGQRLLRGVVG